MHRDAGLTLIEMLVVLTIVGVMASVTVLGLEVASRGTSLESEAQRLAEQVRLVQDDAMVTGRPAALSWDSEGYAFLAWDETSARWRSIDPEKTPTARHELPDGIRLTGALPSTARLRADPLALAMTAGRTTWRITSDGLNVVAAPAS